MTITTLGGTLRPVAHDGTAVDAVYGVDADGNYLGVVCAADAVHTATSPPPRGDWVWADGAWQQITPVWQRKDEIDLQREGMLAAGVEWSGRTWYGDATFQQNLLGCLAAYTEGVVPPEYTFPVRSLDKVVYQLNRAEIRALSSAVLAFVQATFVWSWDEKAKLGG